MTGRKGKRLLIICALMLLVCTGGFFISYLNGGYYLDLKPVALSNVTNVAGGTDGRFYVANNSGEDVIRIDEKGEVDLLFKTDSQEDTGNEVTKDVAVDTNGNIYVHSVFSNEDALSWYGGENIYHYDAKGRAQGKVYENTYETPAVSYEVNRLQRIGDSVYAILLSGADGTIKVLDLVLDETLVFSYPEDISNIKFAVYHKDGNCIYAYTKDGRILEIGEETKVLYETQEAGLEELSFSAMSIDEEGKLFFSDAATGALYELENGFDEPVYADEYFIVKMNCMDGDIYTDAYSLMMEKNGEMEYVETIQFAKYYQICHVISMVCLYLGIFCLVILAGYALFWILVKAPSKIKLVFAFGFVITTVSIGICVYFAGNLRDIYRESIVQNELTAAKNINSILDKEAFVRLDSVTDFNSADYQKVKAAADAVMLDEEGTPGLLYLMMYTYEDGCLYLQYSEDEGHGCNYPYYYTEDDSEQTIYDTGMPLVFDMITSSEGVFQSIYYPIKNAQNDVIGIMEVGCDLTAYNRSIENTIRKLLFSIAAVCVVVLLIILEFIEFSDGKNGLVVKELKADGSVMPVKLYRFIVFLIFFLTNITTPFLAIYALALSKDISVSTGISPEILAAVPISAEVVAGAIFSLLGSGIIRRLGSRKSAILGSVVFAAGLGIRAIYPSLLLLIAGNFIQGAGWGIMLLIVNARLASLEDPQMQEIGFTDYNIAVQNGINSGVVFGGFLLAYTNYNVVLTIVAILSISAIGYCFLLIYDEKKDAMVSAEKGSMKDYIRFVVSPRILFYLVLIVLPVISASYYLNYLYPILADGLGMSEDWIGYSYLLNGMVMICFGNMINSFVAKRIKSRSNQMMAASVIYLIMFGLVGYFNNITVLLISLVLMAITCSFGYVAQSTFFAELKEVEQLGYEKAMGVYSLFENLAQAGGSFLFGYIMVLGIQKGLFIFGMIIAGSGILFAVLMSRYNKKPGKGLE